MTARQEFPAKICAAAFERAEGHCEQCTAKLYPGRFAYDHVLPCALGGEPTLENCQVLCSNCHSAKTFSKGGDVPRIAKMKRQRNAHIGIKKPSRFPGAKGSKWKIRIGKPPVLRSEA